MSGYRFLPLACADRYGILVDPDGRPAPARFIEYKPRHWLDEFAAPSNKGPTLGGVAIR